MFVMGFRIGVVTIRSTLRSADKVPVVYSNRIAVPREHRVSEATDNDGFGLVVIASSTWFTSIRGREPWAHLLVWLALENYLAPRLLVHYIRIPVIMYLDVLAVSASCL